jgi:hypothetical protein
MQKSVVNFCHVSANSAAHPIQPHSNTIGSAQKLIFGFTRNRVAPVFVRIEAFSNVLREAVRGDGAELPGVGCKIRS